MNAMPDTNGSTAPRAHSSPLEPLVRALEAASPLDAPAKLVRRGVNTALSIGKAKNVTSGRWLGHAVHPMLTDVVVGAFTGATFLDLTGGDDAASRRLIALGIAAYGPTAATGFSDWSDREQSDERIRRVGLIHAWSNATALGLYSASLVARRKGNRGTGIALGALGATVLGGAGFLGGHMTLRRGAGTDRTALQRDPAQWRPATPAGQR